MYVLSKTKVKFGGLEIPFKKNSFGKETNYQWLFIGTGFGIHDKRKSSKFVYYEQCLEYMYIYIYTYIYIYVYTYIHIYVRGTTTLKRDALNQIITAQPVAMLANSEINYVRL